MSGPDPDLDIAALAAVRHWTYKPNLLNGEQTEVDTTITVIFSFGLASIHSPGVPGMMLLGLSSI
jgi:outer membrane biosynthesis protein TonB